jgi:predicted PurR-regulated permease PerM
VSVTRKPPREPDAGGRRLPVPPLLGDLTSWAWRLVLLGGTAWLALLVAERLALVVLPLLAALLLCALLSPGVRVLRRWGAPRAIAVAVVAILACAVLGGVMTWVVSRGIADYPELVDRFTAAVDRLPVNAELLRSWQRDLTDQLQQHRGAAAEVVTSGVQTAGEVVTALVLTAFLTLVLLADGDRVWAWLVARLPSGGRERTDRAGRKAFARLARWIQGTVVIALFHAVVVAITLALLGVPLVVPLAVLVFLGSFIPIVGAVIFGGLAALVTFAAQGLEAALVLVAVLLVDNQVEAHVLQPFLIGRYVRLHPLVVLVVITAGAALEGLAGAILAVPLTAAASAALTEVARDPQRPAWRRPARSRRAPPAASGSEATPRSSA